MTVPSPYRVKYGSCVAAKDGMTNPPPSSNRSTTSRAPVGWAIGGEPAGVGDGGAPLGAGEPVVDGAGVAPGAAEQAATATTRREPRTTRNARREGLGRFDMRPLTSGHRRRFLAVPRNAAPIARIDSAPRTAGRVGQITAAIPEGASMSVIIIREMVGTSPTSWSDAARQAVTTASRTVRNIRLIEVVKSTAIVENGEIVEYRVDLKIGFEYEG